MRLAALPLLASPLLLGHCGADRDLIIGITPLFEVGTASATAGGAGAAVTGGVHAVSGAGGTEALGGAAGASGAAGGGNGDCLVGAEPPRDSLIHRYRFDDSGTTALDAISGSNGNVVGAALDGSGLLTMNGDGRQYVDLPNGIVSSLTDVTIVTWLTWSGGAAYQRIFDFGSSNDGEGLGTSGHSYLAVIPMTGFEDQAKPGLGAEIKAPGFPTVTLASVQDMKDRFAQVSLVFESGLSAALYLDGILLAAEPTAITLADIDDRNNWIGQSQWQSDPVFQGSFEELRIYDVALDACQLHTLLVRGPETP